MPPKKDNETTPPLPVLCHFIHPQHSLGIFYGSNPFEYEFTMVVLELVVIIVISRIMRFILKPLRQPRIVADILGGIIVGPSVLGLNKTFQQIVFPESAQFVMRNIGIMGFMFFLFISGVKIDLKMTKHTGKKDYYIALMGIVIPSVAVSVCAYIVRESLTKQLAKPSSIGTIATTLAITTVPALFPVLKELNMLSSELARMSLSACLIADIIGINCIVAFEAAVNGESDIMNAFWYMISVLFIGTFTLTVLRRFMVWIVHNTPEGKPVKQAYVVAILLGVFVMGFLTDMFGVAIANGPFWLGLVIPDGPPLGSTLVERCETIVMELLLPFSYALVGGYTNVFSLIGCWENPLFAMAMTGYLSKMLTTALSAIFYKMTFKDGLLLSLILNLRGQIDLILIVHWLDKMLIDIPSYTLMVVLTALVTAIETPLICLLYDPTRPYMVNKRRTIQHTSPNSELNILLCIHEVSTIRRMINLLDFSNPSEVSSFRIYGLNLVEMIGRATPMLIDHGSQHELLRYTGREVEAIRTTLQEFQDSKGEELIQFQLFTAVTSKRSMYQDICELALDYKAILIILTYQRDGSAAARDVHSVNKHVLSHAPCSVAVLVEKPRARALSSPPSPTPSTTSSRLGSSFSGSLRFAHPPNTRHHLVVLFLGGGDAREALVYADRMALKPDVSLTVIRFMAHNNEGDVELEKKLDDGVVTWFYMKSERNERVMYREVVVRNGEDTTAAILAMKNESYDLWIVGRNQTNKVVVDGLADWNEDHDLGVVGDFISSEDFSGKGSVLVVQQQRWRG